MDYVFLLGRQKKLSIAELRGQKHFKLRDDNFRVRDELAFIEVDDAFDDPQAILDKLGGTIKIMKLEQKIDLDNLKNELKALLREKAGDTKFNFAISSYIRRGISPRIAISVKKELKSEGIKLRFIQSHEKELSSVQISKNRLDKPEHGVEFNILEKNKDIYIATTCAVQDFESYSERDYGKPGRSARLGMLPPKLAQVMLNMAGIRAGDTVLDPFCGTGTVLTEAVLMGVHGIASDWDPEQVERAKQNVVWLNNNFIQSDGLELDIFQADARNIAKELENRKLSGKVDVIVSEGYLGPARAQVPPLSEIKEIFNELAALYRVTFSNYAEILPKGARVVMTLPYYRGHYEQFMPEDKLLTFSRGFTLVNPLSTANKENTFGLKYSRQDQVVGREVFVWEKM